MIKKRCDKCNSLLVVGSLRGEFYKCDICSNFDVLYKGKIKKYRKVVLKNEN